MRHFSIVLTQEGRLRLGFFRKEHGLLHDRKEKKTYGIVREAYPTNWAGRFARAYIIYEDQAQTVRLGQTDQTKGATVEVIEPLRMEAEVTMPQALGGDGKRQLVRLTGESMWDRTNSVQLRRIGNRRFQWYHALMFIGLGALICLGLVAAILFSTGGSKGNETTHSPAVNVPAGSSGAPQSGPTNPSPSIIVSQPGPTASSGT